MAEGRDIPARRCRPMCFARAHRVNGCVWSCAGTVDLVINDVVLPGLDGGRLARAIAGDDEDSSAASLPIRNTSM